MKVTAVLAIRNEEAYLANCLRDLISNGLDFVVIDNDLTDSSAEIYGAENLRRTWFGSVDFHSLALSLCQSSFSERWRLSRR